MTRQAKPYRKGVLKRPRTVFLGDWSQDELGQMGGLVGELYNFCSFEEARKDVILDEVDLVITRNARFIKPEEGDGVVAPRVARSQAHVNHLRELEKLWSTWTYNTFLVHFGGTEMLPRATCSGAYLYPKDCQHRELLVTGEPGELQDLARSAIKACEDGRELVFWINHIRPASSHSPSMHKPLEVDEWLVRTDEGGAPAFHWFDEQAGRGMLVLQEPLCRTATEQQWLAAVLRLWHEKAPNSFPDVITWEDEVRWQTAEERQITEQLSELEANWKAALAEFTRQEASLKASLEKAKSKADQGERRLLTTQDDELVEAVTAALSDLGFTSEPPDDEETNHKKEDLLVTRDEWPGWGASVEVKGKTRSGAKGDEATKLDKRRRARGTQQAILFVNGEYGKAPSHRGPLFSNNQEVISMVKDVGVLVVDTRDLYQALFDETLQQELISAMRSKAGTYPDHVEEPGED